MTDFIVINVFENHLVITSSLVTRNKGVFFFNGHFVNEFQNLVLKVGGT